MRTILLLSIFYLTLWSCSSRTGNNSISDYVTTDSLTPLTNIDEICINHTFPFGCGDLIKYKYPRYWRGHTEGLLQPNGKEFEDIAQCFIKINTGKTIGSPKPKTIDLLTIGDNFKNSYNLDTVLQKATDSCRYRLPNIANYECYYSFQQNTKPDSFGLYGNLLLLEPKTKEGKLLNIYSQLSGDAHIDIRYFFIEKNVIRIYEGACYDDGCYLDEKCKISINQDGEIHIKQVH